MRAPRRGSVTEIETEEMVDNVPSSEDDDAEHTLTTTASGSHIVMERPAGHDEEEAFLADDTNHFATTMLKRSARNAKDPKVRGGSSVCMIV